MEGNRKTQIRVGIFLGLGLLAALISILALGGEKSLFRTFIHLKANLEQVQGLAPGSVVSLSGVAIGNIEDITFGEGPTSLQVQMKIDKKFKSRIPKNSTVEIRTQGALGDKFIYIIPGDFTQGMIESGDVLLPAVATDLFNIISEKSGELTKVFEIVNEVHKLMRAVNSEARPEKMMRNFAEASISMKEAALDAKKLVGELRSQNPASLADSMKKINSILTKIDKGEGTLGSLINDNSLHEQLRTVFGGSPRKQYIQTILQNSIEKKPGK